MGGNNVSFIKVCCMIITITSLFASTYSIAYADSLDMYRNIISSNNFTLKYENISPAIRVKNGDAKYMTSRSSMDISQADYMLNQVTQCIIVALGDKRYEEVASNDAATCRFRDGDNTFIFSRVNNKGKINYFGSDKNKVRAIETNKIAIANSGESFGGDDATILLNAMLSNDKRAATSVNYQKIAEGRLNNGLNYIDYKSQMGNQAEIIRYYLQNGVLVKISAGFYTTNNFGTIVKGRHCILKIKEFKDMADVNYLKLPDGVKDETDYKRRDQAKEW